MPEVTYPDDPPPKRLIVLHGEIKTPPLSRAARVEAGYLIRLLQEGEPLALPHSRPMPSVGRGCHELRINDVGSSWRIIYYVDTDAVVVLSIFSKKTDKTPRQILEVCRQRLASYQQSH